jgi:hypothetical protein
MRCSSNVPRLLDEDIGKESHEAVVALGTSGQ